MLKATQARQKAALEAETFFVGGAQNGVVDAAGDVIAGLIDAENVDLTVGAERPTVGTTDDNASLKHCWPQKSRAANMAKILRDFMRFYLLNPRMKKFVSIRLH